MTLLEEIQSKCSQALIDSRQHGEIAAAVSVGRTKPTNLQIGKGTIIEVIGLSAGNDFLDAIEANALFRHVKHLLTAGTLNVSSPMVPAVLESMVAASVITQTQADALLALSVEPDPVSVQAVVAAMEGL